MCGNFAGKEGLHCAPQHLHKNIKLNGIQKSIRPTGTSGAHQMVWGSPRLVAPIYTYQLRTFCKGCPLHHFAISQNCCQGGWKEGLWFAHAPFLHVARTHHWAVGARKSEAGSVRPYPHKRTSIVIYFWGQKMPQKRVWNFPQIVIQKIISFLVKIVSNII